MSFACELDLVGINEHITPDTAYLKIIKVL